MGTVSVSLPSDGETIEAADYNTPINTIVNEINGNLDNSNLDSAAAIAGSKLADASITNSKLSTSAGEIGGDMVAWTPTLSGRFTDGDWTKTCKYKKVGKTVFYYLHLIATDSTPMAGGSGEGTFTLPVTSITYPGTAGVQKIGNGRLLDSGTVTVEGDVIWASTTTANIRRENVSGTNNTLDAITSTVPFTWTTNDEIYMQGCYETP